jgi:EmrB/QacA subfamily drug resistance transporter
MGVGAAIITPVGLAVLPVLFAPSERPKAIAVMTMGMGIGIPLGPIVGGYLLEHYWWGSIFLINVPVALLGALAIGILLPESKDPRPRDADLIGGVLSTVGLISLVYGVIEAPGRGWTDPLVVGSLLAAAVLLSTFVWWELRSADPMIDLRLFGRPAFRWGTVAATLATFALFGLLFVAPQYLTFVLGYDALDTGLRLLPLIAGLVVGSPIAAKLSTRYGHRIPVTAGLIIIAAGLVIGSTTAAHSGYGFMAGWFTLVGVGIGAALAPAMDAVLGALPPQQAGSGTAITMTLRQTAGALGVALLGSVLSAVYVQRLDVAGLPAPAADLARESTAGAFAVATRLDLPELARSAQSALVDGVSAVLLVCAGIALLGAVLAAFGLPARVAELPETDPGPPSDGADQAGGAQRPTDTGELPDDLARTA